jgi:radical SAM superfamily enzyme YgiQ (UPF0313 family)
MYPPHDINVIYIESIPALVAYLQKRGFVVDVYQGKYIPEIVDYIAAHRPRYIGISVPFTFMAENARKLLIGIKIHFPSIPIIMGGTHVTICPEDFIPIADYVCVGDGEHYLDLLLSGFEPTVKPLPLDEIPEPVWIKKPFQRLITGDKAYPYSSSRGCPFACGFCSNWLLSNRKIRYKSIRRVLKDLQEYKTQGINCFAFRDETFTADIKRVRQLCYNINRAKLDITWWCQTRAGLIDEITLHTMKKAGCIGISIGVESGNERILQLMNKQITKQQIQDSLKTIKAQHLVTYAGFMIGHPWDTKETIEETITFADELKPDYVGYSITIPYPGTRYNSIVQETGGVKTMDYSKYRSPNVVYVAPALKEYDLKKIKHYAEYWFFVQSLNRIYRRVIEIACQKGIKPKIHGVLIGTEYMLGWLKNKIRKQKLNLERCKT